MNDTPLEVDERYRAMLMQRTGEARMIMGCAMRDTARAFVEASLRELDPQATESTIRKGLFLRFYGHEYDPQRATKSSPRSSKPRLSETTGSDTISFHPCAGLVDQGCMPDRLR
jgi:hypothetical protein